LQVALKLVDKKNMKNMKAISRVRSEMANMKKLGTHNNVVSLYNSKST